MDQNLRINGIKKMISEQQEIISKKNSQRTQYSESIEEIDLNIEYLKEFCGRLLGELHDLGVSEIQSDISNFSINNSTSPTLSKAFTFQIIDQCDNPSGIDIKSIIIEYENVNIQTHNRLIGKHIEALIDEGSIYQTNPDHQRGRKFLAKE
ncbi:MAG: hypothetical protein V3V22_09150 [Methylococcales bacterium]